MQREEEMLQDERNHITTGSSFLRVQDRSIRRLKCAVAFCFLLLFALVLFTVFLIRGGFPDKTDKGQMDKQQGTKPDTDEKPKAHLTGRMQTGQTDGSAQVLQWEAALGLAFLKNGMIYFNNSIIIPKEGFYFVYSQLSFRPSSSICVDDKTISQSIMRSNANYPVPETILSGISFCTKDSKKYQPIYLGGLLQLRKGDHLKVHLRPGAPIDTSVDHKTFFGAFLV
ncbi:tumor necrosis factor ligand superfamily member 15 [Anomaloglossus baeobatrachus]|uniref:tumor necrosis factor ligand superfamily member 15 n=1 Tax=Anomaloglossus baeobatrachus TaxID=238106 RepID=UPI003F50779A